MEKYVALKNIEKDFSINIEDLCSSIIDYLVEKKKYIINDNLKEKIQSFCDGAYFFNSQNPLFTRKFEEMILSCQILKTENTMRPKKRI